MSRRSATKRGVWRRPEPLGILTSAATRATSSVGGRALLAQAEDAAERGLHIVRALLWLVLGVIFFGVYGLGGTLPAPLVALVFPLTVIIWELLRRVIWSPVRRPWVRYAMIVLDGWVILRPVVILSTLGPVMAQALGDLGITRSELVAALPPLLVYLAVSGSLRLDPRAAALSTGVALAGFVFTARACQIPAREAIASGGVVAFSGIVGVQLARILRVVALRAREEEVLERYVPETLTQELARTGQPDSAGRQAEVTVLMADIREFTRIAERLTPTAAVALLNDYFAVVVAPLAAERAVLDGYIGDGLLAFFEGDDRAQRALRAADGMRAAVAGFNLRRSGQPLCIGIAIHAGVVLVGTIGAPTRREYTIVGDAVNVTERLEQSNKALDSVVVASAAALVDLPDPTALGFRGPQPISLRGRDQPIVIYYLPRDAPTATC